MKQHVEIVSTSYSDNWIKQSTVSAAGLQGGQSLAC